MADKFASVQLPRAELAPAGISGDLLIALVTASGSAPTEADLQDQQEREFTVYCLFSREIGFARDIPANIDSSGGSSFFRPDTTDPGHLIVHTPRGDYRFVVNSAGEFAGVTWSGRAANPQEARLAFITGIAPALDYLSYLADTPLIISNVIAHDHKHDLIRASYTTPYADKDIHPGDVNLFVQMGPIYALYREAKNATSPFYRFLCYYKILEGIYLHLRPDVFKRAKNGNVELMSQKEVIPEHPELRRFSPELVGKPIKTYFDNELQPRFRNAVAHFLLENGDVLNPSDPKMIADFQNVMFAVELASRAVIGQQEDYYRQLETVGA